MGLLKGLSVFTKDNTNTFFSQDNITKIKEEIIRQLKELKLDFSEGNQYGGGNDNDNTPNRMHIDFNKIKKSETPFLTGIGEVGKYIIYANSKDWTRPIVWLILKPIALTILFGVCFIGYGRILGEAFGFTKKKKSKNLKTINNVTIRSSKL
jgi:hypothetical protein